MKLYPDENKEIEMSKSCTNCIHYEICSLWSTTDLDEDEAYKYCYGRYKPKLSEDSVVIPKSEYNDLKGLEKNFDDYLIKEIKEAHKETAKKVLNDVYYEFTKTSTWKDMHDWWLFNGECKELKNLLDKILKEIIGEKE